MSEFGYWAFLGSLYLLILTVQEIRGKPIPEKYNFLMMGLSLSIISHVQRGLIYLLGVLVAFIVISLFLKKHKEKIDFNTLTWSFYGFALIGMPYTAVFAINLIGSVLIYSIALFIIKRSGVWHKYPVFLVSFIASCLILRLY